MPFIGMNFFLYRVIRRARVHFCQNNNDVMSMIVSLIDSVLSSFLSMSKKGISILHYDGVEIACIYEASDY
jgi:hypothetical protein